MEKILKWMIAIWCFQIILLAFQLEISAYISLYTFPVFGLAHALYRQKKAIRGFLYYLLAMVIGVIIALWISFTSPSSYAVYLFNIVCLGIVGTMILLLFKEKSLWLWLAVAAIAVFINPYLVDSLNVSDMDYNALQALLNFLVFEAFVWLTAIFLNPDSKTTARGH